MSKYKIIITLILFCFFQTTPSISLELKLKIPKDLKKLGDKVKKELEKKTPEVKKEEVKKKEVKKEEVKKKEVKKEEVKKEEVKLDPQGKDVIIIWKWSQKNDRQSVYRGEVELELVKQERTVNSDLPNCSLPQRFASGAKVFEWYNCYAIKLMDQGDDDIFGNDPIDKYEGEFNAPPSMPIMFNGKGIYTFANGDTSEGIWKNDDIVKSKKVSGEIKVISEAEKQKMCEDKDFTKSKNLGGYKNFYFGMPIEDALKFKMCVGEFMMIDETDGGGPLRLDKLYNEKHEVQIYFENDKVDMIALRLFSDLDYAQTYSFGVTSIEKFEQIKKVVLDKYKLIAKPEKNSIDEFNREKYANLTWTLKDRDFEILLQLTKSPPLGTAQTFFYKGWISYLSPDRVKKILEKKDGEKVKSDDL